MILNAYHTHYSKYFDAWYNDSEITGSKMSGNSFQNKCRTQYVREKPLG